MNNTNTLYCHGWSSGSHVWEPLVGDACNASPRFRDVMTSEAFLPALKQAVPQSPHVVVGWSMGGMLALEYAAQQPSNLKGLVLIGTTPKFVSSDRRKGWPAKIIRQMIARLKDNPATVLREFQAGMFSASERTALKSYRTAFADANTIDFGQNALVAGLNYLIETDLNETVDSVSCPTLWVHGTDDAICPPGCLEGLPSHHKVCMIEEAGHVPHWSRPDAVNQLIAGFVDGL